MAIGATDNDGADAGAGHVRIFEYTDEAKGWTQMGKDIDGESSGDRSGESVSLSSDGRTLAIGASDNDGAGKD